MGENWIDAALRRDTQAAGVLQANRKAINFGSGFIVADDPTNNRINVTSAGGGGGITTVASLTALRNLGVIADGIVTRVTGYPDPFYFSAATGAGFADDGKTVINPTGNPTGSPGRHYPMTSSPVVATFAALLVAVGGTADCIHVQAYQVAGDGGGGIFDRITGASTTNGGTIAQPAGASFHYRRRFGGELSVPWFGILGIDSDTYETTNRTRWNALNALLSASALGFGVTLQWPSGVYHFDSDLTTDIANPTCILVNNIQGLRMIMAPNTEIRYTGAAPAACDGAITSYGTSPPTITLTGTRDYKAVNAVVIRINVDVDTGAPQVGLRGVAKIDYSLNGGDTWVLGVTTAATILLGASGYTANLAAGTYNADNVWKTHGPLALIKYRRVTDCEFQGGTFNGQQDSATNNRPHIGGWLTSAGGGGQAFHNKFRFQRYVHALGVGFRLGNGTNVDVNLDANSFEKCRFLYNGNDLADQGVGLAGLQISDANTNYTNIRHSFCESNGPWPSLTNGCGVEIYNYPRNTVFDHCGWSINSGREVWVHRTFGGSLVIKHTILEMYRVPFLEIEGPSGGVGATGQVVVDDLESSYSIDVAQPPYDVIVDNSCCHLKLSNLICYGPRTAAGHTTETAYIRKDTVLNTSGAHTLTVRDSTLASGVKLKWNPTLINCYQYNVNTSSDTIPENVTRAGDIVIAHVHTAQTGTSGGRFRLEVALEPTVVAGSFQSNGVLGGTWTQADIDYTMFKAQGVIDGSTTSVTMYCFTLPAYSMVRGVRAQIPDTGSRFRGGAISAVTLEAGWTGGDNDGLLLPFDVYNGPAVFGFVDSDMGAQLTSAQAVQGGFAPTNWGAGNVQVQLTMRTTGANISALTQGKVRVWLNVEVMQ
jgi:hypothetical protein